jgi:hypothetical protein
VTDQRRQLLMRVILVLDVFVCAAWAFWTLSPLFDMVRAGSGGVAAVSFASPAGLELLLTVAAPVISIWLAHLSNRRLAKRWRNAHLLATLALIIVPMVSFNPFAFFGSLALFLPAQVFFVIGAVAIWIGSPRRQPARES